LIQQGKEQPVVTLADADLGSEEAGLEQSLRLSAPSAAHLSEPARDWIVPGADEFFRGIYTRAAISHGETTLAVSSAISGDGKTTLSLGLAVTLAQDFPERSVVVVETDSERPVLAKDFGLEPNPGLFDCLAANLPIWSACRGTYLENLHLLPAGGPITTPGRWLRSDRLAHAVDNLRRSYDIVILDAPALLVNSDALYVTDLADGVLFVVRAGLTPASLANQAMAQLDDSREKLRGVVVNDSRSAVPGWVRRLCGL